jgi:secondary thiamine-phosphate synthase enzyme
MAVAGVIQEGRKHAPSQPKERASTCHESPPNQAGNRRDGDNVVQSALNRTAEAEQVMAREALVHGAKGGAARGANGTSHASYVTTTVSGSELDGASASNGAATNGVANGAAKTAGQSPQGAAVMPASFASEMAAGLAAFALPFRALTRVFTLVTERHLEFRDITHHVVELLRQSGIREGFAVIFSRHTTAGIRINEHEPLLLEDMAALLERVVPANQDYRHDDFSVRTVNLNDNERINGHSHCRSLLLGASETVPVAGGRLLLGHWQRIFLVELDGPSEREFVVQLVGG